MSTTVTYKDNTLTTISNATKTLKTAGKYMEDDVVLTDLSTPSLQSKSVVPSTTQQVVVPDGPSSVIFFAAGETITTNTKINWSITNTNVTVALRYPYLVRGKFVIRTSNWNETVTLNGISCRISDTTGATAVSNIPFSTDGTHVSNVSFYYADHIILISLTESVSGSIECLEDITLTDVAELEMAGNWENSARTSDSVTFNLTEALVNGSDYAIVGQLYDMYRNTKGTPWYFERFTWNGSWSITSRDNDGYTSTLSFTSMTGTITIGSGWRSNNGFISIYKVTDINTYDGLSSVTVSSIPSQYIVPTGTKSITENGTGIDVAQYASVDVTVPAEDSTLVVTLSYNDQTEMWEPDKTFAETKAAYDAGKTVAFECDEQRPCSAEYDREYNNIFYNVYDDGPVIASNQMRVFLWNGNGITEQDSYPVYSVSMVTAVESDVAQGKVFVNSTGYHTGTATTPTPTLQSKSVSYTPSETAQSTTVTADSGYDGLSSVDVSVGTISSTYVGSGITRRSSTDLTASGATVTVPAGYYSAQASKAIGTGSVTAPTITIDSETGEISASTRINAAGYLALNTTRSSSEQLDTQAATTITPSTSTQTAVEAGKYTTGAVTVAAMPSGTAGTPIATKGTVSNHSVSVTPSVNNTTGYITGGTKTGTAVSVSASELVSGTLSITSSGTHDVTNYASATVPSGSATASATKGSVSNHSITVTPSVTRTAGYVTAGTANGTAVTVSASELVSGSETKTANGTYDVTNLASVTVAIPIVTYHTSSSAPTSSQGSNGDLWLVTA